MRDPNRISPFLAVISEYWKQVPDWRFGQLISNVLDKRDPFYMEEDELLELFDRFFNGTEEEPDGR